MACKWRGIEEKVTFEEREVIAWIHTFMCSWNDELMKVEFTTIERSRMRRSVVSLTEVGMVLVKSW